MDKQLDKWIILHKWIDGLIMNGYMDEWMDGQMDKYIDRWGDGWMMMDG